MNSRIHKLSMILTNQIAAGEVIERPASVVKELIENSIDANSTQINIDIQEAGLKYIKVSDNGDGIYNDDLKLALKRHFTSKIFNENDLFQIDSLGFRGEALASIAAISDVKLASKTNKEDLGSIIHVRGNKVLNKDFFVMKQGTNVEVKDLFFNTPARLKYLKSYHTELSKIVDITNRIALGHVNISFSLKNNNNIILRTNGNNSLYQTAANIYGIDVIKKMISIKSENLDFKINGLISLPELTRSNRNYITILINGRYIKNLQLNKSIIKGYGSRLMIGRFPIVIINIEMDPLLVDVNVHPRKQEVRLSKENNLCDLICQTIEDKLSDLNLIPSISNTSNKNYISMGNKKNMESDLQKDNDDFDNKDLFLNTNNLNDRIKNSNIKLKECSFQLNKNNAELSDNLISNTKNNKSFPYLRYLAQLHGTYLLSESDDGLYILDQHAVQERIKYEFYKEKIGQVNDDQQDLLIPIILNYTSAYSMKILNYIDILKKIGLNLENFGNNSFIIRSHPTWFPKDNIEAYIRNVIELVVDKGKTTISDIREETAIMISCKTSIKANHHLEKNEAQMLIDKLATTNNPFNCPHGRPTLIKITNSNLEKMFKRIQDNHNTRNEEMNY